MLLKSLIIFYFSIRLCDGVLYNRYDSRQTTDEELCYYKTHGTVDNCTVDIQPCNESDWRSIDGTCNNLEYPTRGSFFSPMKRLLPAHYFNGTYERKAKCGEDLPLPRVCRTTILQTGVSHNANLTQHVPFFGIFLFLDIGSVHDINNFLFFKTDCCEKEHMNDYQCTPNIIPEDDPVHRFSGIRCMNLTRPLTYQDYYCTKDSVPSPIAEATLVYDLSNIYDFVNKGDKVIRSFSGGELAVEEEDGKIWPPNGPISGCPLNRGKETRCYNNYLNGLLPIQLYVTWFVRYHNFVAKKLAAESPCWDDQKIFQTTRDIIIAISQQINVYDWMVSVIGYENLLKAGVISKDGGFRDLYNKETYPQISLEFNYAMRWFHSLQDATTNMCDTDGTLIDTFPMVNLSLRTGWLPRENHMTYVTQGSFRQPCKAADHSVHPDMADLGIATPDFQTSVDILASDLHKSRLFGLAPYIDYLYLSQGLNITCFDDLSHVMSKEMVTIMKDLYKDKSDIDLMGGMWAEDVIEGGNIGPTLAYFIMQNILQCMQSDRHWYERKDRPHACTADQLCEIRKATLARMLCDVGDDVTQIQKHAFRTISDENPLVCCSEIPEIDFSKWADPACNKDTC